MSTQKFSWYRVMVFAGAYVATIIGSGFATGQEILQFFASFGLTGIIGCFITAVVFAFVGAEILYRGSIMRFFEPIKIYRFYCGNVMGTFLEYFVPLFLFGVYVIMISGAGATLEEYYGLNPYVGRIIMSLLALGSVVLGLERMMNILGNVGPVIIVFTLIVGVISFAMHADGLSQALEIQKTLEYPAAASNGLVAGILYPCYNMVVVGSLLAGMGATTTNKKECIYGGVIGGVGLALAVFMIYMAMLAQPEATHALAIPSLLLASQIHPVIGTVFSVILMLGIYTTATPLLWQTANRFVPDSHRMFKPLVLGITVAGFIGGLLNFKVLVNTIYPFTGYLGIVILVMIVWKSFKLKREGRDGSDEMVAEQMRK